MQDANNINPDDRYVPSEATRSSWFPVDRDYLTSIGYPLSGKGKHAQLTYQINQTPMNLSGDINLGQVEIKDGDTSTTLTVLGVGESGINAIPTILLDEVGDQMVTFPIADATTGVSAKVKTNTNTLSGELLVTLQGHQCDENTTFDPLPASGVFTGSDWQDTLDYGVLSIGIHTDQDSALDGLEVQWSHDGITPDDFDVFNIKANKSKTFTFGPAQRYYRIKYTNGPIAQSELHIVSIIRRSYVKPSSHRIQDNIVGEDDAELVKSIITGVKPDGIFSNISLTQQSNLKVSLDEYGDTPSIDAFDRLRTSDPHTLFDSKQLHDKQPLFWDEEVGGSATSVHVSADAATKMTVTANAADYVIRQTKQRPNYQPGKSQLILMTYYGPQETGLTKRIGVYDGTGVNNLTPNNGIFFETDGTLSWNICKAGTTTESVPQSAWNYDKMDGTGPSLITLDTDAAQILIIDFEWLGVGRVRVGFVIDGIIHYVHYFNHANSPSFDSVYMSTPNLPLRYSIESDGSAGGTLDHICSTVISEGGVEELGVLRDISTGTTTVTLPSNANNHAILGIRLKSDYKDVTVTPTSISVLSIDKSDMYWSLILNPTVGGTGWTYNALTNSALEVAINSGSSDNVVTGGIVIGSGFISAENNASADLRTALKMGSSIAGINDELVLCIKAFTTPNKSVCASMTVRELL